MFIVCLFVQSLCQSLCCAVCTSAAMEDKAVKFSLNNDDSAGDVEVCV